MLRLRPYHPNDAQHILNWIEDETAFRKWSADRYPKYPITPEDMNAHYAAGGKDFFGMTAFDDDGIAGHLIMRFPDSDRSHLRLGFIIVDSSRRGKGYGREMLRLAQNYAFSILKVDRISLGVFENNPTAQRCYRAAGFSETGGSWSCHIMGEEWKCIEMAIAKENNMRIIESFECGAAPSLIEQIKACDWSAAQLLAQLLEQKRFEEVLGEGGKLLVMMDGDRLMGFATLTQRDCVDDDSLFPWIGFVFVSPEYRGHRYSSQIIDTACEYAKAQGHSRVYLATDHVGFYEKYGFEYMESRIDIYNEESRVYFKDI